MVHEQQQAEYRLQTSVFKSHWPFITWRTLPSVQILGLHLQFLLHYRALQIATKMAMTVSIQIDFTIQNRNAKTNYKKVCLKTGQLISAQICVREDTLRYGHLHSV